ncbi:MAG: hypothetical protein KAR31_13070 [Candidatus Omnitrophica bacterium]|nr:hypothetical protein [Candidatus Omnitrophota bacterium]
MISLEGKAEALTGGAKPVECVECYKKYAHSGEIDILLPISDRVENAAHKKQTTYLWCYHCGHKICYKCMVKSKPKELRYICQACGKATNGMEGLSERWSSCRREFIHADEDFGISEMTVAQGSRMNEKAVHITVSLTGKPYGSIEFNNTAINIDGSWFLATPEPLVKK